MACDHTTKDCQCCAADAKAPVLYNRPALSALEYRIGEYGHFLQRMVGKLQLPVTRDGAATLDTPLRNLATRRPDDHTIALLDAWAVTSDVLTFYQERIANEGFLRTATERRSVLELASEIGYELSPGVAAETDLAFQVEEITNPSEVNPITLPDRITIPKGTQVMSMPQGDELPQTFETLEEIEARPAWNALRPLLGTDQRFAVASDTIWLEGTSLNLKPGMRILITSSAAPALMVIKTAEIDTANGFQSTKVVFTQSIGPLPSWTIGDPVSPDRIPPPFDPPAVRELLASNPSGAEMDAALTTNEWSEADILRFAASQRSAINSGEVYVLRDHMGVFGNTAPYYGSIPATTTVTPASTWESWSVWMSFSNNTTYHSAADLYLERALDKVEVGGFIAIEESAGTWSVHQITKAIAQSLAAFGISARVTGLELSKPNGTGWATPIADDGTDKSPAFNIRNSTVHLSSEKLPLARMPITAAVEAGTELALDALVLKLSIGQRLIIRGEQYDAPGVTHAEGRAIAAIQHINGRTIITLDKALEYSYKRSTVKIMANVVRASHGETVKQVLGSGDAGTPHQHFTLSKAELTHVQASTANGRESTLTVRVDGVAWKPIASLYEQKGTEKVFITRIDDDARASIQFGDGKMGARVPTGQVNIEAQYRSGIGLDGEVAANTLTLLKSKPYGVRSVINPVAASGAEDPEKLATARDRAPFTVRTLDRVVSLFDYEDLAAAFSGIGKTQAVALWNGQEELVHITVLDTTGKEVSAEKLDGLRSAIAKYRDPNRRFLCESGIIITFSLSVNVLIDAAYQWAKVEPELRKALSEAFSYEQRSFGQPATRAEVMEVMHRIGGVVAVDIETMDRDDDVGMDVGTVLPSGIAEYHEATNTTEAGYQPASLLVINESGLTLQQMSDAT